MSAKSSGPSGIEIRPRLLIVDDEMPLMRSLCDTLRDQGYETTGLVAARDALTALGQQRFDLMLADLSMPEMNGIALLREALAIDNLLVGIIMTGEGTIGTAVEAMRMGAYDYILKPFKLSTVLPVVKRGLALHDLRVHNSDLERRLRERAEELEVANRELDAFTRSASHDLRTPLASIVTLSDLLQRDVGTALPDRASHWLELIRTQSERAVALLDDLMRLSRLGHQALVLSEVDVSAIAGEVMQDLLSREPGREVDFSIAQMPAAFADPSLLRQVYVNLLSNALKFTRGRRPATIEAGAERSPEGTTYFVRDNGAGFDRATSGKLFDAFERLHRQEDFEGSGVGLSIVKRVVERHGGRIWAEGKRGCGACFHFTLRALS